MSTVGELILEKKNNFCKFLLSIVENEDIKKKVSEDKIELYKQNVEKLNTTSIEIFIFWITKEVEPKKDKLDEYPARFLKLNGIDYIEEFDNYKDKILAYLKLFIDLLDYTFGEDEN